MSEPEGGASLGGEPPWEGADENSIPLAAIEHYSYCPRQCALIYVERVFDENEYTVRGRLVHERVDSGLETTEANVRVLRSLSLWSRRLRLNGKADLVELRSEGPYPVELKSGQRRGVHADLQLCAQALCLEEMLGVPVPRGAIYYYQTRRRHEVLLDPLRERTQKVIEEVRELLMRTELPPPATDSRCRLCSLQDACVPDVVAQPDRLRGFQSVLFRVVDE